MTPTLSSEAGHFSYSSCNSGYNGRKNLRGFGTEVIEEVEVLIKVLRVSNAGLYKEVSGSCNRNYEHALIKPSIKRTLSRSASISSSFRSC